MIFLLASAVCYGVLRSLRGVRARARPALADQGPRASRGAPGARRPPGGPGRGRDRPDDDEGSRADPSAAGSPDGRLRASALSASCIPGPGAGRRSWPAGSRPRCCCCVTAAVPIRRSSWRGSCRSSRRPRGSCSAGDSRAQDLRDAGPPGDAPGHRGGGPGLHRRRAGGRNPGEGGGEAPPLDRGFRRHARARGHDAAHRHRVDRRGRAAAGPRGPLRVVQVLADPGRARLDRHGPRHRPRQGPLRGDPLRKAAADRRV